MAQLKSTNITGNLAVSGNVVASKIIKLDGTANEVLCADGTTKTLSSMNTIPSAYCATNADYAAKAASCTGYTLSQSSQLHIIMTKTNTAASALTLNVNSQGAKPIYINGNASSSTNYTLPAGSYIIYYDGTNYYFRTDGSLTANITGSARSLRGKTPETTLTANSDSVIPTSKAVADYIDSLGYGASYTLPLAANGTRGGIQIGYSSTENNRAVSLSGEKAYVDLPDRLKDYKATAQNSPSTSGWYFFNDTTNASAKTAFGNNAQAATWVSAYSGSWAAQLGVSYYSNGIAFRRKNNSASWSEWVPIATQEWVEEGYLGKTAKAADSDKLDGQDSTYYLNYSNLTNKPTIPTVNNGTLTMATSGTGISGSATFTANQSSASTFTVTLNSSIAGNRSANQVVLATAAGQINSTKYAITSAATVKATWQYNSTTDCIELIWA